MFNYIKIFSIVSLVAVLIIATLVGFYFRSLASGDLLATAEKTNMAAAQGFAVSIWREQRAEVMPAFTTNSVEGKQALDSFANKASAYVNGVGLKNFNIYDKSGRPIFTTNTASISDSTKVAGYASDVEAKKSKIKTMFVEDVQSPDEKTVRSFIPFYTTQGVEVLIETQTIITKEWHRMIILQWVISGGMMTVCLVFIWMLIIASKKADEIISKQHDANVELEAAAAAARAETQQKSMFLANISHELRTPLNAIIGFSDIIKTESIANGGDQRFINYINDINQAGTHLLSLINDILDFSKAEAGKLELEISEVNASKLVANCLRLVLPRAEAADVNLEDAMPRESLVLSTDNKKLKQVLLNLLSNAVKFTPAGGKVRVSAWRDLSNDCIGFEVRDSGIGIAAKDISKAMTPFGQIDSALSRKYEGTGLGLPLTKKFVELMGGTFSIQSEVNVGTTVSFMLPTTFENKSGVPVKMVE